MMVTGLIGKKLGMTQVFDGEGQIVPVTVVEAGPCTVVQVRSQQHDGYDAVQLGFGRRREKLVSKPCKGHAQAAGRSDFETLVEVRLDGPTDLVVGQEIKIADVFAVGDVIDVRGRTKGRGFAGVMKRHNFGGHRSSHGTHESFRGPGSVGAHSYPARIWKGKRMAGHMGQVRRTIQNLEVVAVRPDENLLFVRGGVPGARNERVMIQHAVKAKKNA